MKQKYFLHAPAGATSLALALVLTGCAAQQRGPATASTQAPPPIVELKAALAAQEMPQSKFSDSTESSEQPPLKSEGPTQETGESQAQEPRPQGTQIPENNEAPDSDSAEFKYINLPDSPIEPERIRPEKANPYQVRGVRYTPQGDVSTPYVAQGTASWYGKKFHRRKTAIGERYNMHEISAAHPTLPLPCYVRVTNLENGKTLIVRVNDRGPFVKGREIDLSYEAAKELGYAKRGTTQVRVEKLTPELLKEVNEEILAKSGDQNSIAMNEKQ